MQSWYFCCSWYTDFVVGKELDPPVFMLSLVLGSHLEIWKLPRVFFSESLIPPQSKCWTLLFKDKHYIHSIYINWIISYNCLWELTLVLIMHCILKTGHKNYLTQYQTYPTVHPWLTTTFFIEQKSFYCNLNNFFIRNLINAHASIKCF